MNPFLFILLFSIIGNVYFYVRGQRKLTQAPRALLRLKRGIEDGKPNRRLWHTLRSQEGFDDHYRRVPGRMTCTVLPLKVNKEDVWQLRIGFRTTAADKPSHYMSIPMYANGQIYDV